MQLPQQLTDSIEGVKDFNKEAFEQVHSSGEQITSIRINPFKQPETKIPSLEGGEAVPWSQYGYYLSRRPSFTFDPLFHAGCYYVQEASGMFLEQVLQQAVDLSKPVKILDLCAAPGGKSTHIQSLISKDSLLVSNEVIKSRVNILKDNIVKWGGDNGIVTNNDPKDFAKLENYFDVIVADAPCSGSGLFRRDGEAVNEWSLNNVALCSQRQQRILADVWPALKNGGILIYSTCSYSAEENEDILDWVKDQFAVSSLQMAIVKNWNITEVQSKKGAYGYRFWPYKIKGEGFFAGCFKKTEGEEYSFLPVKKKAEEVAKKDAALIQPWLAGNEHSFVKHNNRVYALNDLLRRDIDVLLSGLRVQYAGVNVGEIFGDKLVPSHALAMSNLLNDGIPFAPVSYEQAIRYLQRKDIQLEPGKGGWSLVKYEGFNLGWVKVLQNRVNNYYPKELRILKDS